MKVFNKDQMAAVNSVVDIIRQRARDLGYGGEADRIIERALAEAQSHPADEAASAFAATFVTELFNGGGVQPYAMTVDDVKAKVIEVFRAGYDNAVATA